MLDNYEKQNVRPNIKANFTQFKTGFICTYRMDVIALLTLPVQVSEAGVNAWTSLAARV